MFYHMSDMTIDPMFSFRITSNLKLCVGVALQDHSNTLASSSAGFEEKNLIFKS